MFKEKEKMRDRLMAKMVKSRKKKRKKREENLRMLMMVVENFNRNFSVYLLMCLRFGSIA
jgi:hypothetical protein